MFSVDEAYAFLEETKKYGSVLGLHSIETLLFYLDNPQEKTPVIHVAGTNGKGSVCCYLSTILTHCGYRVGTFTSPAVFSYEERFLFCNMEIKNSDLVDIITQVKGAVENMCRDGENHPTIFEVETAMAFVYFQKMHCDVAVVEVGMGGREDATNVCSKVLCSVLTSIGMDHMQFLGNDLTSIAYAKTGIIKENCPVVSTWQNSEVEKVIVDEAKKKCGKLCFADMRALKTFSGNTFTYKQWEAIQLQMLGSFQVDNAVCALEVVDILQQQGFTLQKQKVKEAMRNAIWHGRMECILQNPPVYIDGAHNVPAALRLQETIKQHFTNKSITYIIGVLHDKEFEQMLDIMLPLASRVIVVAPGNERALSVETLFQAAKSRHSGTMSAYTMDEAVKLALQAKNDVILAFGSLSYLKEIKNTFLNRIEDEHV